MDRSLAHSDASTPNVPTVSLLTHGFEYDGSLMGQDTVLCQVRQGDGASLLEPAQFGIRVNAVEPAFAAGSTASPLTDEHVRQTLAGLRPRSARLPRA